VPQATPGAPPAPPQAEGAPSPGALPQSIGKYRIVKLLGRGGMGAVFQAFDPHLERDVALKVMLPQFADQPEHKLRFEREARAVARMMHPNVVTVFDLGYHTDGSPYIVMELLKGRDLLHLLHEEPSLALRRKVAIAVQVLEGLAHAHKVGIVHRDIKPGNVFIVEGGDAKIMDFGIARISESGAAASGLVVGTANYMSPEQVTGGVVDGRSDLFSVGCMLAEMAGGRPPFESDSVMSTLYRIANAEPILDLPEGEDGEQLAPVLRQALVKDPAERIATAGELAAALRALLARPSFGTAVAVEAVLVSSDVAPTRVAPPPFSAVPVVPAAPLAPAPAPDPTPLFRLLREIYVGGKSGHLHLTSGHERRLLRILKGRIVDGSSDVEGERLGDILVRYGLLSQADLERAVAVVLRERRKIGRVLGEMGLLDRPRLEDALGLHVREVLFVMLDRPGARFVFEDVSESLIEADLACRLSTGELILEATRRVQDPQLVRRAIGDPSRVLVLSSDPLLRMQKITLTPIDGFVLSRIDGTLSAREILSLIPLSAEDVERSLFGLLCTGMVGHLDDQPRARPLPRRGDTAPRPGREAAQGAARAGVPPPHPTPMPPTAPISTQPTPLPKATPTPAPRPAPASTPAPVHAAPAPVPPTPQSMARVMPSTPPPTPQSMARAMPPAASVTPAQGTAGARPGIEEVRRIILETHERLAERTHYEVLGIVREASDAEVRQAHARLVRALHPDACSGPELDDLQEQRAAVFVRVGQAYEVLRDLKARAAYDTHLKLWKPELTRAAGSGGSVLQAGSPPAGQALPDVEDERSRHAAALALAETRLEEEKYWDVIQALEPVLPRLTGALRGRCQLLLARAYVKNPKWRHRAEEALRLAIEDDPRQIEAHLLLARIYVEAGLPARASATYRRVLALDPNNAEALAAEKPEIPPPPETPSALKRLLRKR
jgi:serine/threonine protein kinase